jgi:hypothetical protein
MAKQSSCGWRTGTVAAFIATMAVTAGCGGTRQSGATPAVSGSAGAGGAIVSATPAVCTAGRTTVTWLPGQPSVAAVCVRVGTGIVVALHPDGRYRWDQPTSSDPSIASVNTAGTDQDGGTHVTVSARSPGTAVIGSTATVPADPNSPTRSWRLTTTVVS